MDVMASERSDMLAAVKGADDFYKCLGSFVLKYSDTEALIQTALWHFAGVPSPTAQAAFVGSGPDRAMKIISRIAAAQNWPEEKKSVMQHAFQQLERIKKLRNNILHYGAQLEGPDTWRISNEQFVHVPKNISTTIVSPTTLKSAEDDLHDIDMLLIDIMCFGQQSNLDQAALEEARKYAWKYKETSSRGA
jgi:hypothetical protein